MGIKKAGSEDPAPVRQIGIWRRAAADSFVTGRPAIKQGHWASPDSVASFRSAYGIRQIGICQHNIITAKRATPITRKIKGTPYASLFFICVQQM